MSSFPGFRILSGNLKALRTHHLHQKKKIPLNRSCDGNALDLIEYPAGTSRGLLQVKPCGEISMSEPVLFFRRPLEK
jgi:hypothetical protein